MKKLEIISLGIFLLLVIFGVILSIVAWKTSAVNPSFWNNIIAAAIVVIAVFIIFGWRIGKKHKRH